MWLTLSLPSSSLEEDGKELEQRRNLQAGAEAEATERGCLLVCSSWLTHLALLENP